MPRDNRQKARSDAWPRLPIAAVVVAAVLCLPGAALPTAQAAQLLSATFDSDSEGFTYADDLFRGTSAPGFASGRYVGSGGYSGGGLEVELGGVNGTSVSGMSGGWQVPLDLSSAETGVVVSFRYKMTQSAHYEYDESSEVLLTVDGTLHGRGVWDRVDHVAGDGSSSQGRSSVYQPTTDWQRADVFVGDLAAGAHTLALGGHNNKKDASDEFTVIVVDDVEVTSGNAGPDAGVQSLVDQVSLARFKSDIRTLSDFGDRCRYTSCAPYTSYFDAQDWVADQLEAMGYEPQLSDFTYGLGGTNLWATKVGSVDPDEMYIVSAHLDGRGGGGSADDDGSGVALVLEVARVLSSPNVQTAKSVRFAFWDREEQGLYGAHGYVQDRRSLQGIESPSGSGLYPEPAWLGVIQHDMILYDHGVGSPGANQSPYADMDVEWRQGTAKEPESRALAQAWRFFGGRYAAEYPAHSYDFSTNTDDTPFHPYVASVSVRENRRALTTGSNAEWINPYYHQTSDVYASYDDEDFALGLDTVRVTFATVAELAGATVPLALPFEDDFESDRGWTVNPGGTDGARRGQWERGVPQATSQDGPKQLGTTPSGSNDLVTGRLAGRSAGSHDLDGGVTSVRSPSLSLPADKDISLSFHYTFAHGRGSSADDYLRVRVVGSTTATVFEVQGANDDVDAAWTTHSARLDAFAGQTVYLLVEAADGGRENLVEAAIDDVSVSASEPETALLAADFDDDAEGFAYGDDPFRGTSEPGYASGSRVASGGRDDSGALKVDLGGIDNLIVDGMSGGWARSFTLSSAGDVTITAWVKLTQSPDYDQDEWSQALLSVDGVLYGAGPNDYIIQVTGNGNGGIEETSGWMQFSVRVGGLASGSHELRIGGYNNRKTYNNESTVVLVDDVRVDAQ